MENNDTEKDLFRIQRMLEQVTGIQKTHRQLAAATGSRFNIFEILEKQKKEVAICRMMYELLSPDGSHGQGSCYLRLFFTHVLKQEVSETMLRTAVVYREYCTADNRRIDLVIETADRFIPIEVKIDAGDQPAQCADYYQEAVQSGKQVTLYYLTKYGDAPSEYSISRTHREQSAIETISFAAEIQNWLLACLQLPETIRLAPVREVLLQFVATVKAFTNQMEEKERMEIQDILMASADSMRSAVAIKQTVEAAQRAMLNRFFAAV
ncbi:MAG: PD-(D/E)XK nuclease family protein, partial [Peptococcaceae bacterium]